MSRKSTPLLRLRHWNIFALCYLAAAVLPLTLIPFEFTGVNLSYGWTVEITFEDFARNILLFLPLGLVAGYAFKWPHWVALMGGLIFSLSIETAQLFIAARTSNIGDLVGNSSGAFLGAALSGKLLSKRPCREVPLAFVFVPLCWIEALRSLIDPLSAGVALFSLVTGLSLIQLAPPRHFPFISAVFWLQLATIPFFNTFPRIAAGVSLFGLVTLFATSYCSNAFLRTVAIAAALLGFALTLLSSFGYFATDSEVVMFELLLRTTDVVFSAIATIATYYWYKTTNISITQQPSP